jgi:hypothetical protein
LERSKDGIDLLREIIDNRSVDREDSFNLLNCPSRAFVRNGNVF